MRWEYEFRTGVFTSIDDLQDQLNALGRAGWEAIGVGHQMPAQEVTVLLKRRFRSPRPYRPVPMAAVANPER
jgi:hypothetical protein